MARAKTIKIRGKDIKLPIYFPDATRGVVRGLDSQDLKDAHIEGLVTNTYHLSERPGGVTLKGMRGIQSLINWDRLIVTDSGGFQLFSLIQQGKASGKITKDGMVIYRRVRGTKKKVLFTPEKSIRSQFDVNADIIICLDYFTPLKAGRNEIQQSVDMTVEWAKRCKSEYDTQIKQRKLDDSDRPLLFAVIQGGNDSKLRIECANRLMEIGFDGFGLGGWIFGEDGDLDLDMIGTDTETVAGRFPMFALGVGFPHNIVGCYDLGYDMFDCVLPTRDARHQRLYNFKADPKIIDFSRVKKDFYYFLYIKEDRYVRDTGAISEYCDCYTCRNYSRAYLNHLFSIGDALAYRLATIHNLRFYTMLIDMLRLKV